MWLRSYWLVVLTRQRRNRGEIMCRSTDELTVHPGGQLVEILLDALHVLELRDGLPRGKHGGLLFANGCRLLRS